MERGKNFQTIKSFLLILQRNFEIKIRNLGTGRFAIPRSPKNIDIKIGI